LTQNNITTIEDIVTYLDTFFFHHASTARLQELVNLYPDDPSAGSPFRTGPLNNIYPQYKRLAALLGDLVFTITRRVFLSWALQSNPSVPSWSYLSSYDYGTPVLGTFHASDIPVVYGQKPGFETTSIQSYYLSFVNNLNPNDGKLATLPEWPQWGSSGSRFLMNFNAGFNQLITDDFRSGAAGFIASSKGPELYV
jgi:acetylcholinesterase